MTKEQLRAIEVLVKEGQTLLRDAYHCTTPDNKDRMTSSLRARLRYIIEDKIEAILRIITAAKASTK